VHDALVGAAEVVRDRGTDEVAAPLDLELPRTCDELLARWLQRGRRKNDRAYRLLRRGGWRLARSDHREARFDRLCHELHKLVRLHHVLIA